MNSKVQRINDDFEIINDEILTSFPGELYYCNGYIAWFEPFPTDKFLHVLDAQDGKEVGVMGKHGEGPAEFVSPLVEYAIGDKSLYAYDVNGKTKGYFSIDSLINQKEPFVALNEDERAIRESNTPLKLEESLFLGHTEDLSSTYFIVNEGSETMSFGVYPIKEVKKHLGGYYAYNPTRKTLVFATYYLDYMACYSKKEKGFKLNWEKECTPEYRIIGDELILDRSRRGPYGLCLTRDYIVTIERDYKNDDIDESTVGRDVSKCPKTIFIYNYDSELLKIVNLNVPMMRITADYENNVIYAIAANPDFVMIKYQL